MTLPYGSSPSITDHSIDVHGSGPLTADASTVIEPTLCPVTVEAPTIQLVESIHTSDSLRAETRRPPYFLRGRDREIVTIGRELLRNPTGILPIIGPPGIGKTSLLEYLEHYAAKYEMGCVRLTQGSFSSDEELAATLGNTTYFDFSGADKQATTETVITEPPEDSVAHAIQTRLREHRFGLMITLDEAQDISRYSPDARDRATALFKHVHAELPGRSRPPPVIIVCAGMLNTMATLIEMRLTRIEDTTAIRLAGISEQAVAAIIRDHLEASEPGAEPVAQATNTQLEELSETAEGYPHFVTRAALVAKRQARVATREGRSMLSDADMQIIREQAAEERTKTYDSRIRGLGPNQLQYAAGVIGHIAQAWGNAMPKRVVEAALARLTKVYDAFSQEQLRERLERAGMLEIRYHSELFPSRDDRQQSADHALVPIPSLRTALAQHLDTLQTETIRSVEYSDLLEPEEGERIQPWTFTDSPLILDPIIRVPYEAPRMPR